MIYHNTNNDKSNILSNNKGRTAIYMWTNNISGKNYIGSAFDLSKRLKDYYSTKKLNQANNYISRALLHHGYSTFSLSILEYINITGLSKKEARKLILSREQFYFDLFLPQYNILKEAGSLLGFIHSDKTKSLISSYRIGKIHSTETKSKISNALSGESNPMSKSVFVYSFDPDMKDIILYKSFNTCIEAAKYFDCSTRTLSRYLNKKKLYKEQWILSSFNL